VEENNGTNLARPVKNRGLITAILLLVFLLGLGLIHSIANYQKINAFFYPEWFSDFNTLHVSDGFHKVSIPIGNNWEIAYESSQETVFQGQVLYNYPIRERGFEVMTQDILVTSGDYSNPNRVYTRVSNHHFVYRYLDKEPVIGSINLLHTFPMNEEINQLLQQIEPGDEVVIKGWEILSLEGWDSTGNFLGTWQDAGCNSTLVTQVIINPVK
jgi:hypothetical protein